MSARRKRSDDLTEAAELYESFREAGPPTRARAVRIDVPAAAAVIGKCEFIGYVTTHGKELVLYIHEFAPGSRPWLAAGTRKGQLFLVGGRFKVTELGITDLDARGNVRHARRRYIVKKRAG